MDAGEGRKGDEPIDECLVGEAGGTLTRRLFFNECRENCAQKTNFCEIMAPKLYTCAAARATIWINVVQFGGFEGLDVYIVLEPCLYTTAKI